MHSLKRALWVICGLAVTAWAVPLTGASSFAAEIESAVVERNQDGVLVVRWIANPPGAKVMVTISAKPVFDGKEMVVETVGSEVTADKMDGENGRRYFRLVPEGGKGVSVAERRLPLEGTPNFRDLGGYRTADGRATRWGMVYRSSSIAHLTPGDLDYVGSLGLKLVCDLRTGEERAHSPSRLPDATAIEIVALSIGQSSDGESVARPLLLTVPDATAEQALAGIKAAYGRFALDHARQYAAMFERLLAPGRLPAMVHCTAGKDRTGVASALLLLALGVPRETVVADYVLTARFLDDAWKARILALLVPEGAKVNGPVADVIFDARAEYLRAAFAAIDGEYGSFEAYLRRALAVSAEDQARLRDLLLE